MLQLLVMHLRDVGVIQVVGVVLIWSIEVVYVACISIVIPLIFMICGTTYRQIQHQLENYGFDHLEILILDNLARKCSLSEKERSSTLRYRNLLEVFIR